MKPTTLIATGAVCALLALAASASAQPPAPDKERTNLHTTLKDDAGKSREQLALSLKKLAVQIQAADEVIAELRKADDGSRESRARMVVICLIKERDRVTLMNPVTASLEHLRFSLEKERAGYEALRVRRELDAKITQRRVDALADKLLDHDEAIARASDPEERAQMERRRADLQTQLMSEIGLRDDRLASAREYERAVQQLARERKDLKTVEEWLDHEAQMSRVRVERLNDAVQHTAQEDLRRESDESKKTLNAALGLIQSLDSKPALPLPPKSPPEAPPISGLVPRKPDAPAVTPAQVEEALKQARERRKAKPEPKTEP